MTVKLVAASIVALLAGFGTATTIGLGEDDRPTKTVTDTVASVDTVTKTTTVKKVKTVTRTVTETVTDEPPRDYGGGGTGGDDDVDGDGCSDSYEGACLPPNDGYDNADCYSIPETDFDSVGDDPYGLDRDGDGIACESY